MSKTPKLPAIQAGLDLGPRDRGAKATERRWELRADIVARVGAKEVAYQFDIAPTYLNDVLRRDPRDRKPWRDGWDDVLYALADEREVQRWDDITRDIRRLHLDADEALERVVRAVKTRLGEVGEEILREALR